MENEAQRSAVVDPLANYWGISLFSRTPGVLPVSSKPYNPDEDLDTIHNHLRSMALRSPNKLLEQTKSIVDDNPGLLNSDVSGDPTFDDRNEVVADEAEEAPRERRPALGLKRARFSLKPTKNQPYENLIPRLDIDKLKDPVEFFLAHERVENAKREIQKQMGGVSLDPDQDDTSPKLRQRRPGILGTNRRPVRYRHRYPVETIDNIDYVPSSQEALRSGSLDPVGESTDKDSACLPPLENKLTDSSAMQENNLNDILDGLLSCDGEDLKGDGAITLLQERLQIKPIVLEKLSIPDFPDNRVTDLKSFRGKLSKPRNALSDIDNLLKGMSNNKTPLGQDVGNPVQKLASPTPPKSPFASLASLQKHISQSNPGSVHPFSALETDHFFTRNSSLTSTINQELDLVNSGNLSIELSSHIIEDMDAVNKTSLVIDTVRNCSDTSGESKKDNPKESPNKRIAPLIEDIIAVNEKSLVEDTVRNCGSTSEKSMGDNSRDPGFGTNMDSNNPHVDMDVEKSLVEDAVRNCASGSEKSMEDNSREPGFDTNIDSDKPHVDMDVAFGGSGMGKRVMDDTVGKLNFEANGLSEFEDKMQAAVASVQTDVSDFNLVNPQDQSSPAGFQANAMAECTERSDDGPEHCLQEKADGSTVAVNRHKRVKLRSQIEPKGKRLPRRQSLAAAGTSWMAGVRRSTRIRTRPLEYWKGEKLVYGRVHESLATVIGVKCMSPGSDGKPTMKVKSYVSDNHKELLELASLY